jgi:hypothetical protein
VDTPVSAWVINLAVAEWIIPWLPAPAELVGIAFV